MSRKESKINPDSGVSDIGPALVWLKASYCFHTFAYRDPRSAFASAMGLPVVSPTTVLLGIASTLFSLGKANAARDFIEIAHRCEVLVDAPNGAIFFRAFHQLRRYETDKYDPQNPRLGLTQINQGTREFCLIDGSFKVFVGIPEESLESTKLALVNLGHLGTHDSMCSLIGHIELCSRPTDIVYASPEEWRSDMPSGATVVTLSRFKNTPIKSTLPHWWMAGGKDTEQVPYFIKGRFEGTTRGKIFRKS